LFECADVSYLRAMRRLARVLFKVGVGGCIVAGCGGPLTIAIDERATDGTQNAADANSDSRPPETPLDPGSFCGRRGCGATFHVAIPDFDLSRLPERRVTFCVNEDCYSIEVSFLGGPPQSGIGLPVRTASGSPVPSTVLSAVYWSAPQAGSTCTGSILAIWYRTEFVYAQNGDRYALTVDRADGGGDGGDAGAPFEFSTTATYEITYPNGAQCGPACKQVSVGCVD
jgi:hypothetical protein